MKLKKYLQLVSLTALLTIPSQQAQACWGGWDTPDNYYMYRLEFEDAESETLQNCYLWQRQTSMSIPVEDIRQVVYKFSVEQIERIMKDAMPNVFATWIREQGRQDIADFLLLAKRSEQLREEMLSPWYYSYKNDEVHEALREIVEQSVNQLDTSMRNRYFLQAVRALFAVRDYETCVQLWEEKGETLADDVLKSMAIRYVAGSYSHRGKKRVGMQLFASIGAVMSAAECVWDEYGQLSEIEKITFAYHLNPNSPYLTHMLELCMQSIHLEIYYAISWHGDSFVSEVQEKMEQLYDLSQKAIRDKAVKNKAMWYYTASYIADYQEHYDDACQLLLQAERANKDPRFADILKVMRIYLDAKTCTYNAAYEQRLLGHIQWLEQKIKEGIDDKVREETRNGSLLWRNISYYYWNDMLRKILLGEVCPRMIKAGREVRAMQLANMADNYLPLLVGKEDNWKDFSNSFFELTDSIGVNYVIQYQERLRHPANWMDVFLNERSYINSDYMNDILGTQLLRYGRYAEAAEVLAKVSMSYQNELHTSDYLCLDPFMQQRTWTDSLPDAKYRFALQMTQLEQIIRTTTDPNRKALAQLKYALGMKNSFGHAWALTQYYLGTEYGAPVCDKRLWWREPLCRSTLAKADQLVAEALDLFTDEELAAQAQAEYGSLEVLAQKYRDTAFARSFAVTCDTYRDYLSRLPKQ